jgi:hypothetical protein
MANCTAGNVPAESWFCKLFEHVFNCSITSCQVVKTRLANSEHPDCVVHRILEWQDTSHFEFKMSSRVVGFYT